MLNHSSFKYIGKKFNNFNDRNGTSDHSMHNNNHNVMTKFKTKVK